MSFVCQLLRQNKFTSFIHVLDSLLRQRTTKPSYTRPTLAQDGGTQLTIRGVRLGNSLGDIVDITVCGTSCLQNLQYESDTRIKIVTPPGTGSGPIIITTKSGGQGRCDLEFRYEEADSAEADTIGVHIASPDAFPISHTDFFEECERWIDEEPAPDDGFVAEDTTPNPLRINMRRTAQKTVNIKVLSIQLSF